MPALKKFEDDTVLGAMRDGFWARGYAGTSIRELELDTGLNRSSLYKSYKDKQGLFLGALAHYASTVASQAKALLEIPDGAMAVSRALMARAARVSDRSNPSGCLMTRAIVEFSDDDGQVGRAVRRRAALAETSILEAVSRAQAQGSLDPSLDASAVARLVIAVNHGMCVLHAATGDDRAPEQIASLFLKLLDLPDPKENQTA